MIKKVFRILSNQDFREVTFMAIANKLPSYQLFNRMRIFFIKMAKTKVGERASIRTPFENIGSSRVEIGNNIFINRGVRFAGKGGISIGDNVLIGPRVQIETTNHSVFLDDNNGRPGTYESVIIEDNVWLGAGSIILPGVTVGEGSIVAAGAVVTRDVPKNVIIGGVPAKILKDIG